LIDIVCSEFQALLVADEDVFARCPRVLRAAADAIRSGLDSGRCDLHPLASGLETLVGRARGISILPDLAALLGDPKGGPAARPRQQLSLVPPSTPDLVAAVDRIQRDKAQSRLDNLAARSARRLILRGVTSVDELARAVVSGIVDHYVVDSQNGLLHMLGADRLERVRGKIRSMIDPVLSKAAQEFARRPGARRLALARHFGGPIKPFDDLLNLGKKR
jgi:hypothetical protein